MTFIVGLTGGIGCGKSTVADLFAQQGAALVDTDCIAHELTVAGGGAMAAISAAFGPAVLQADGSLDRTAMRRLAFSDPAARLRLEAILHPMIREAGFRQCQEVNAPYVLLVVPLLVETGVYHERVDRVLVVDCDESLQIARVMARSGLSSDEVMAIMAHQAARAERLAIADDVLVNNGTPEALLGPVAELHQRYLSCAAVRLVHAGVKADC